MGAAAAAAAAAVAQVISAQFIMRAGIRFVESMQHMRALSRGCARAVASQAPAIGSGSGSGIGSSAAHWSVTKLQ